MVTNANKFAMVRTNEGLEPVYAVPYRPVGVCIMSGPEHINPQRWDKWIRLACIILVLLALCALTTSPAVQQWFCGTCK